jgi:pimeloyl-ACP methyl ester carboxylesterase
VRRFLYGDRQFAPPRERLEDWPKISAPTMLIWGEQDVALNRDLTLGMDPLFTTPPRIEYIPDSGHFVQQEKPERVNALLLDFLGHAQAPVATSADVAT